MRAAEAARISKAAKEAANKAALLADEAARVAERDASSTSAAQADEAARAKAIADEAARQTASSAIEATHAASAASSGAAYALPSSPVIDLPGVDLSLPEAVTTAPAKKSNTILIAAGLGLAAYLVFKK